METDESLEKFRKRVRLLTLLDLIWNGAFWFIFFILFKKTDDGLHQLILIVLVILNGFQVRCANGVYWATQTGKIVRKSKDVVDSWHLVLVLTVMYNVGSCFLLGFVFKEAYSYNQLPLAVALVWLRIACHGAVCKFITNVKAQTPPPNTSHQQQRVTSTWRYPDVNSHTTSSVPRTSTTPIHQDANRWSNSAVIQTELDLPPAYDLLFPQPQMKQ